MSGQYRKRPVVIEAIRLDESLTEDEFVEFFGDADYEFDPESVVIHTLEGDMTAHIGDWIIKGVKGEFYPCKPDIFDATYEAVIAPGQAERAGT